MTLKYLITQGLANARNFCEKENEILELISAAAESKISLIQIREKCLEARLLYQLTEKAAMITRQTDTKLLVNDRADIALAAGADGVQLRADSLSADIIRRLSQNPLRQRGARRSNFMIGVSTHLLDEVETARRMGADFVVFGPVFATPGKENPQGIEELARVVEAVSPFPIIAIGGIDDTNADSVLDAGAAGFASIRFLNNLVRTGSRGGN